MSENLIRYLHGDATHPVGEGVKIICHCCNDEGKWGRGFVLAISKRWPIAEGSYRKWYKTAKNFELGEVQFVKAEEAVWVANLIGQHGVRKAGKKPPVRYDAIESGLLKVAKKARDLSASVHMPRIGCGLAGGQWAEIESAISRTLIGNGIAVTVYDLPSIC